MNENLARLKDITVLYCEDEKDLREVTAGILENFTANQFIAKDGAEGLKLFLENKDEIDLVVTDVNMPNMTGLEMASEIKKINRDMPVIVATAFSNSEYLLEAINLGVDKYVLKPVDIKKLTEIMSSSLLYHELRSLYRDSLTHLPTRNALLKDLYLKEIATVALIDIDGFSMLNDLYGEANGDQILITFMEKLKYYFSNEYKIYRTGADKFVILDIRKEQSTQILKNKCEVFAMDIDKNGLQIASYNIYINVTIGIAQSEDQHSYEYAQRALQKARSNFLQLAIYNKEVSVKRKDIEENLKWIKKLKNGITDGKFQPYFQPIIDSETKKIHKYEALIRYVEDDGTQILPSKFLPIAKKAKFFHLIIKIMLNSVIDVINKKKIKVAVNISYQDIINKDTYSFIFNKLEENKEAASMLDFELLETDEADDFLIVREFIQKARSYGCKVGIDDFGAGYSNFNMLEALNVDFVKIDGSLIKNIDTLPKQALIVETISNFCLKLGILTVAEYVHNEEIYLKIKNFGVTYSQGWYFGKAINYTDI